MLAGLHLVHSLAWWESGSLEGPTKTHARTLYIVVMPLHNITLLHRSRGYTAAACDHFIMCTDPAGVS